MRRHVSLSCRKASLRQSSAFSQRIACSLISTARVMETNTKQSERKEDEEEFVLLDLDGVCEQVDIPPNVPYVLSGLDTLKPTLVIDDKLKLIGEYEETIGTSFVFTENDGVPVVHEETGPSEANLFTGKCIIDPNQASKTQVKPIAHLHKILKFRLASEVDLQAANFQETPSNL